MSPSRDDLRIAARDLLGAALEWAEKDFGDAGDLHAEAVLADAVLAFRLAAQRAGVAPGEAVRDLA